ncbi:MAG: DJ-1/PfpI family protein [Victivallales bacterium]|nr:DJ-1/PfpI family protein [Victivallales bacterium]
MSKKIAVFLAPGFEEIEALTTVDVLRRAGFEVVTAAVGKPEQVPLGEDVSEYDCFGGGVVQGAHGIPVVADCLADGLQLDELQMAVCPGGLPGATNLQADQHVLELIRGLVAAGRPVAAICAAPIVLGTAGVLAGRKYTCYPGFEKQIADGEYTGARVQNDGLVTTGVGPGASLEFALALVAVLGKPGLVAQLSQGMIQK